MIQNVRIGVRVVVKLTFDEVDQEVGTTHREYFLDPFRTSIVSRDGLYWLEGEGINVQFPAPHRAELERLLDEARSR